MKTRLSVMCIVVLAAVVARGANEIPVSTLNVRLQRDLSQQTITPSDDSRGIREFSVDTSRFIATDSRISQSTLILIVKHSQDAGQPVEKWATADRTGISKVVYANALLTDATVAPSLLKAIEEKHQIGVPLVLNLAYIAKDKCVYVEIHPSTWRTWTDRKGRKLQAQFLGIAQDKLRLKRKTDGKEFHVALNVFSDADQAFVRANGGARDSNAVPIDVTTQDSDVSPERPAVSNQTPVVPPAGWKKHISRLGDFSCMVPVTGTIKVDDDEYLLVFPNTNVGLSLYVKTQDAPKGLQSIVTGMNTIHEVVAESELKGGGTILDERAILHHGLEGIELIVHTNRVRGDGFQITGIDLTVKARVYLDRGKLYIVGVKCIRKENSQIPIGSDTATVFLDSFRIEKQDGPIDEAHHPTEAFQTFKHAEAIDSLQFSPDGELLAAGDSGGKVKIWSLKNGAAIKELPEAHKGSVSCVTFSLDGKLVASACDDDGVKVWDLESGAVSLLEGPFRCTTFSSDAARVFCGGFRGLQIRNRTSGIEIAKLETGYVEFDDDPGRGMISPTGVIAVSPSNDLLVSAASDMVVRLWKIASSGSPTERQLRVPGEVKEYGKTSASFVVFPDGKTLLSVHEHGPVRQWDSATGKLLRTMKSGIKSITSGSMTPDGKSLAVASGYDEKIAILDLDSWKTRASIRAKSPVWNVALSPDGTLIAGGGQDKAVSVWRLPDKGR